MAVLRPLSRRAAAAGASVSVLLRPATIATSEPAKQAEVAELGALGIHLVPGDVASVSVAELADLFAGYDEVLSCIGFAAGRGTQLKLARGRVAGAGDATFRGSSASTTTCLVEAAPKTCRRAARRPRPLRAQTAVDWVIISTGMFTSFLFEPSFGVVDLEHNVVNALGAWDNDVTITTPEDIGLLTTEILFAEPRIRNQVVHLAGDTITDGRLADLLDSALDRRAKRVV